MASTEGLSYMPGTGYIAKKEPPSLLDRIMGHSWSVVFSFFALWGGLRFIVDGITENPISNTIGQWDWAWELALGLSLTVGAVAVFCAVLAPGRTSDDDPWWRVSKTWRMDYEVSGLIALSGGYLGYGVGLTFFPGVYGGAATAITIAVGIASGMRAVSLYATQRRARSIQTRMEQTGDIDLGGADGDVKGA